MSRRASFFARTHPGVRRVRFPDEIVFDESIKEADGEMIISMLRRASVDININRINMAGMTALHQVINTLLFGDVLKIELSKLKVKRFPFFLVFTGQSWKFT